MSVSALTEEPVESTDAPRAPRQFRADFGPVMAQVAYR